MEIIQKKVEEEFRIFKSVIYGFKTCADVEEFMDPFLKKGYFGTTIFRSKFFAWFNAQKVHNLINYIEEITDKKYRLGLVDSEFVIWKYANILKEQFIYYSAEDEYEDSKERYITQLQKQVQNLEIIVNQLQKQMIEVYHAPGMPGSIEAKEEFDLLATSNFSFGKRFNQSTS